MRFTGHTHRDHFGRATALRIDTHTQGQAFGTFARVVRSADGATLHETAVLGFGAEQSAVQAARRWIDAQRDLRPAVVVQ